MNTAEQENSGVSFCDRQLIKLILETAVLFLSTSVTFHLFSVLCFGIYERYNTKTKERKNKYYEILQLFI
jgi:hypothetical protein